jgi:hypothetical protein
MAILAVEDVVRGVAAHSRTMRTHVKEEPPLRARI